MSDKFLVIVESPTKAKTIRKFLPKEYIVEASMGHIRDLPQSAADIPAKLKKEEWAKLGVNVEEDFDPLYVTPKGKGKIVRELKSKLKQCSALYLATDEDREGESISWHLIHQLKPKVPVKRMVFHEITKTAIKKALENCREIDMNLVKAQEARRILDRIYGYTLSPLIWKKIAYGLSAGRVQSTGLRLIAEREKERMLFVSADYWDLKSKLAKDGKEFEAKLTSFKGTRIASGKDFDERTGKLKKDKNVTLIDEKLANEILASVQSNDWNVTDIKEKESTSKPSVPFITSTLQQEGNRKLGMSAKVVMMNAQRLYEQGFITYMRTDSPSLSQEAINAARTSVEDLYGKDYLSPSPRQFKSKNKGAQEAHEAIRPSGNEWQRPQDTGLSGQELKLYELIWKRTMATQMAEAKKSSMSIKIQSADAEFTASGTKIVFEGYLRAYVEGSDNPDQALESKDVILPALNAGDKVLLNQAEVLKHSTKPPARYTEASLVQKLEAEGIGRPSTYASIIGTILDRGYVKKEGNALIPSFTGMAVIQLLMDHFSGLVDYKFTSDMEESLDEIAEGGLDSVKYLSGFYLGKRGLKKLVEDTEKKIKPDDVRTIKLPHVQTEVDIKVGRYGPYIIAGGKGKDEVHASIPEDIAPADLKSEDIDDLIEQSKRGPVPIGVHPDSGDNIYCLTGRYGPYVQLGEATEENPKPKRASLPKTLTAKTVTLDDAVRLLLLPRELGEHPEKKLPVIANNGRFGPYVGCDGDFRSLKKEDNVYTVSLDRALELLSEEKKGSRGAKKIKEYGKHPKLKKNMALYDGKYGMFLKLGTKNIGLPEEYKAEKDKAEKLTVEQITKIIDEAMS